MSVKNKNKNKNKKMKKLQIQQEKIINKLAEQLGARQFNAVCRAIELENKIALAKN